jgi:hypothetical protein
MYNSTNLRPPVCLRKLTSLAIPILSLPLYLPLITFPIFYPAILSLSASAWRHANMLPALPLFSAAGLFVSFSAICVAAILLRGIYNRYFHPLAHFPGPFWGSVSDFYKLWIIYKRDAHTLGLQLHKKYGEEKEPRQSRPFRRSEFRSSLLAYLRTARPHRPRRA